MLRFTIHRQPNYQLFTIHSLIVESRSMRAILV